MKNRRYDIIFFSSDDLAAEGLHQLLRGLPLNISIFKVNTLPDIFSVCKKYCPRLIIYLFHENMGLNGVLHSIYTQQQNYPNTRQLIISCKLVPVFAALRTHMASTNVASLKTPLVNLSQILTKELTGSEYQPPSESCADLTLPDRQLKILLMLSWNYSVEQVAHRMGITSKTVYAHKQNALTRMKINTRQDIADLYSIIDELRMIVTMIRLQNKKKASTELINTHYLRSPVNRKEERTQFMHTS